jgi:hypothetical protein
MRNEALEEQLASLVGAPVGRGRPPDGAAWSWSPISTIGPPWWPRST